MGRRGPAPTPTEVLKLRGSWRAKVRDGEPQPEKGRPVCPRHLTKEQRRVWKRVCELLEGMNVLSIADGAQLERYAVYLCRWRDCEAFVARYGMTYPMKSEDPACFVIRPPRKPDGTQEPAVVGFVEYPQVKESHRLDVALKQIEAQFGLTPASRTRLQADPPPKTGVASRQRA